MSEFAPICIYLVISPLVSLIPLGVPFLFASNSSTYPEKWSARCGKKIINTMISARIPQIVLFFVLLGWDDGILFSRIQSMMLGKGLSFLLKRIGWGGSLILVSIGAWALVEPENLGKNHMMAPSGSAPVSSGGDKEVTSSSSGNWQKFLNLASEGYSTHEPSTSSSAPNQGPPAVDQNQGEGGHEATNPPTEVMGPEAPSPSWLKNKIQKVFYQIKGRRTRSDVIERLWEDLRLESASAEKRVKILKMLAEMYENSDSLKNSRLNIHLAVSISDWERGLGKDDVP